MPDPTLETLRILAANAGLNLDESRLPALQPALERLTCAARWIATHELGIGEPAFVFDPQVPASGTLPEPR